MDSLQPTCARCERIIDDEIAIMTLNIEDEGPVDVLVCAACRAYVLSRVGHDWVSADSVLQALGWQDDQE
jgi:hypothetical protein